jgi:hypothetical protein
VEQYLALTMLRTQRESIMAAMMTPLLTRRGSCRLRSDAFISPYSAEPDQIWRKQARRRSFLACLMGFASSLAGWLSPREEEEDSSREREREKGEML